MSEPQLPIVALRQRREEIIARLCEHFARDHLETEELEQRIDRVHRATSLVELEGLLEGLPSLAQPERPSVAPVARPGGQADQQVVVAVMGGAERSGPWTPARTLYVTAVMGGAVLDFRQATLAAGVTDVYVLALMGGVEIVVPPNVLVESNGVGIMGGFEHAGRGKFPVDAVLPVLRVSGLALMGGVEISVRAPGEPSPTEVRRLRHGGPGGDARADRRPR